MEKVAQAIASGPGHYVKDKAFRYVLNYDYCFKTFAKQRWLGRRLFEVFVSEFKAFSENYYVVHCDEAQCPEERKDQSQWQVCR